MLHQCIVLLLVAVIREWLCLMSICVQRWQRDDSG
jgi:hypothetical protein